MIQRDKIKSILRFALIEVSLLFAAILVTVLAVTKIYKEQTLEQTTSSLKAYLTTTSIFFKTNELSPTKWCSATIPESNLRYTILNRDGDVLCDTFTKEHLDNHKTRKEVLATLRDGWGSSKRFSDTTKMLMIYGALLIKTANGEELILRASIPVSQPSFFTLQNVLISIGILVPMMFLIGLLLLWFSKKEREEESQLIQRLKQELMANISHELRTPLTSIKGYAQLLALKDVPPDIAMPLKRIEENASRLSDIFSDILDISLIENINDLNLEEISLPEMIDTILSTHQNDLASKHLDIFQYYQVQSVTTDARLLDRILSNLIGNAIKYSDKGMITISTFLESHTFLVVIKDAGIGIEKREQHKIFDRFYRINSEESNKRRGSGLGLSIAKNATLKLGGTIHVESEIGTGSIFTVKIPIIE